MQILKTKSTITFILLVILLISGFNYTNHNKGSNDLNSKNGLIKRGILYKDAIESSIFVFDDKLYYLVSEGAKPGKNKSEQITIYSYPNRKKIKSLDTPGMRLASVFVEKGKLHVFLTKDWANYGKSTVYLLSSNDLRNFTSPVAVVRAETGEGLFNTSVTKNTKTNEYIMALEFDAKGYTMFSIRFLKSKDLLKWTEFENHIFGDNIYAACPKIKYVEGNYYLWYAVQDKDSENKKLYKVKIAKSANLKTWAVSNKFFLSPSPVEGINNSDVDLEEYKNKAYVFYADGNQENWGNIRYAVYNGSIKAMVKNYFD